MSDFSSPKKGSNIICRVSNATPEMVCKYVSRLPKQKMAEEAFRKYMGKSWFQNEHQAPEQWGLYYIDGSYYYPRFNRDISLAEAERYLYGWIKRLIVINPYTRFKSTNDKGLVESIVKQLEANPNEHDLKTIISNIINTNEPIVVNEIIANAINNYSEVLAVTAIDKDNEKYEVELLPNYKEIIKKKYNMTKKEYFDLFNDISIASHKNDPKQKIFYGAPGSGKSYRVDELTSEDHAIRTTFHPDTDYSTFVGAYKPVMEDKDVQVVPVVVSDGKTIEQNKGIYKERCISYKYMIQAFMKAYLLAWKKMTQFAEEKEPQFLIIEEINRGNCAQIFGDLFQLLDRSDNGFSTYPIDADTELQKAIFEAFNVSGEYKLKQDLEIEGAVSNYRSNYNSTLSEDVQKGRVLLLPPNFYIWATMNTSDQSLFPMDSAFKRRWEWEYVPICYDEFIRESKVNKAYNYQIDIEGRKFSWINFLRVVNDLIKGSTDSEDKQMGNFFIKHDVDKDEFVSKVMFYLWSEVCKDNYNTRQNFFRTIDDKQFSFNDLFKKDGKDTLLSFMQYLQKVSNDREELKDIVIEINNNFFDISTGS